MQVILKQDTENSYLLTIDGIVFTVMTTSGETFEDYELEALESLIAATRKDGV